MSPFSTAKSSFVKRRWVFEGKRKSKTAIAGSQITKRRGHLAPERLSLMTLLFLREEQTMILLALIRGIQRAETKAASLFV